MLTNMISITTMMYYIDNFFAIKLLYLDHNYKRNYWSKILKIVIVNIIINIDYAQVLMMKIFTKSNIHVSSNRTSFVNKIH